MNPTIYVPGDAAALAFGADAVAAAISEEAARRGVAIKLVRNGSRGMVWLEPLVEVATPLGRIAYGPVRPADVPGLFAAGFVEGGVDADLHPLCLGTTDQIPWLARQQRLVCRRVGVVDPRSLADYLGAEHVTVLYENGRRLDLDDVLAGQVVDEGAQPVVEGADARRREGPELRRADRRTLRRLRLRAVLAAVRAGLRAGFRAGFRGAHEIRHPLPGR